MRALHAVALVLLSTHVRALRCTADAHCHLPRLARLLDASSTVCASFRKGLRSWAGGGATPAAEDPHWHGEHVAASQQALVADRSGEPIARGIPIEHQCPCSL